MTFPLRSSLMRSSTRSWENRCCASWTDRSTKTSTTWSIVRSIPTSASGRTFSFYSCIRGDHLIIEKLQALEHYRLDHGEEDSKASLSMEGVLNDEDDDVAKEAEDDVEKEKKAEEDTKDEEL